MEIIISYLVLAVSTSLMFAPSIIAYARKHNASGRVLLTNIFLCWLPFVYIAILLYAIFSDNVKTK